MTTMMDHPASAQGHSAPKKALIERLNIFTAFALGIIGAILFWYLAKAILPANTEGSYIKTNQDQYVLLSMIGWFFGFMIGIGALIGPFRWLWTCYVPPPV